MPTPPTELETLQRENRMLRDRLETLLLERDLKAGTDLLALFIRHSPIYSFIKHVTPDCSRVIVASENYEDMIGVPGSQMAGKSMHDLFPPEFAEKITADDWFVASSGRNLHLDEDLNGRHYTTFKFPIILGDRTLLAGYTIDITDRRRAEEERRDLQASLAQSDRLASMGMLAAGVAHEINNPLAYVLFNAESLAEELNGLSRDALPPETLLDLQSRLRDIIDGASRIQRISRDLNTFSRQDGVELVPVQVQDSIEHALNIVGNELRYRARVVQELQPTSAVLASEGKLAQVFLNLLINSIQAFEGTDERRNEIRVRTWQEGDQVCAEVGDTGPGIPPENQGRIFEPFFTTKGIGSGTGLGLSICRNIITGFSGEIGFFSEPGSGTRFWVRLPAAPLGKSAEPTPKVEVPAEVDFRGRILVIDDEPGIRTAITRILGRRHDVIPAASGEEARELLERGESFDVVICDLMMSKMSGMELHAWLSGHDPELAARVVFMTGGVFTPGAAEYLAGVKNLRIEKPFDTAGFKAMVDGLVLATRHGRPSPG